MSKSPNTAMIEIVRALARELRPGFIANERAGRLVLERSELYQRLWWYKSRFEPRYFIDTDVRMKRSDGNPHKLGFFDLSHRISGPERVLDRALDFGVDMGMEERISACLKSVPEITSWHARFDTAEAVKRTVLEAAKGPGQVAILVSRDAYDFFQLAAPEAPD